MKRQNGLMGGWLRETVFDYFLWGTLVISALVAFLGNETGLRFVRIHVGTALVAMGGALIGIVLAGLAIFVVFLDRKYVELIEKHFSIESELWAFKWTAIITIVTVTFGMGLILVGEINTVAYRFLLFFALWSFSYLLCEIYELVKFLAEHAKTRATQIQLGNNEDKSDNQ